MGLRRSNRRQGLLSAAEQRIPLREPAPQLPLRIIGVDPGLATTGWGVVEASRGRISYIAHGFIETGKEEKRGDRLNRIYKSFLKILKTYEPAGAAMEKLYFGKNVSSAMAVAEARGVLLLALAGRGLPVLELTPNAIKQGVTGVTKADKNQVQEMVRFLLGLAEIPEPDHAADALAAAICAANQPAMLSGQEES